MSDDDQLADRRAALAGDLAHLALSRRRTAADERRITRGRRAVEKAAALLGELPCWGSCSPRRPPGAPRSGP